MFSNLSSAFMPKAAAAAADPGWYNLGYGIRQYGFSDSDLNSSLVDNPYDNADKVAELYKNGTIDSSMQDRIQTCFGVKFVTDSDGKLDTQPGDTDAAGQDGAGGPNPNAPDYESANCGDTSETWTRIRFFIMDLTTVKSAACYEGDGQSCLDLGVTQKPTTTNVCTGTATPGTVPATTTSTDSIPSWTSLPTISGVQPGGPVQGTVSMVVANTRNASLFAGDLHTMTSHHPDFILLNEISNESPSVMEHDAPGYTAYRDESSDPDAADQSQTNSNALMWDSTKWDKLALGRMKITDHDHTYYEGKEKDWNRYAVWGIFKRKSDGAIVPVIVTHMMTNPAQYPKQWSPDTIPGGPMDRTQQYTLSMQLLRQLMGTLSQYGPVLVGGDMNSHPGDGDESAASQMKQAGYNYIGDTNGDVLYAFNPPGTKISGGAFHINLDPLGGGKFDHQDHALQANIDMNSVGTGAFNGSVSSSSCSSGTYTNNLKPGNAETPDPSVVQSDDGTYHIYASGFQHLTSTDAVTWKVVGGDSQIFSGSVPSWLGTDHWAPEVSKTGDHWTMVFSGGSPKQIGYATSSSAGGPFTYQGVLVPPDPSESGYVIDPHLLTINSSTYILYYGSDKNHGISAVKLGLSGNTLSRQGNTIQALKPDTDEYTTEGAYVVKHGDWYYMYYSAGNYTVHGDYRTRIARSKNPFALFDKKPGGNTILDGNSAFVGPGGGSVLTDAAGQDWLYYHAEVANGNNDRLLMLDKITYGSDEWPTINGGNGPTNTPQQGPSLTGTSGSTTTGTTPIVSPGDPKIKIYPHPLLQHENKPGSPSPGKKPLYITPKGITLHWWADSGGIDKLY
ncbi:MAG: family 43 glycosylhydrolase, partial [Candidatus Saccharimonadales bacterium]